MFAELRYHRDFPTGDRLQKDISGGYHPLTPGKTIMLPANYTIAGLQSGSFKATRFQSGERPKFRVRFYGSMGNVC